LGSVRAEVRPIYPTLGYIAGSSLDRKTAIDEAIVELLS
jgi:hypothetical protein